MNKVYIVEEGLDLKKKLDNIDFIFSFETIGISSSIQNLKSCLFTETLDLILIKVSEDNFSEMYSLGQLLNKEYQVSFIFIMDYTNKEDIDKLLDTKPSLILNSGFSMIQFYFDIQCVLNKRSIISKNIQIMDGQKVINLNYDQIIYLKSEGNYVHIYSDSTHFFVRSTLNDILSQLPEDSFMKIHLRFAINVQKDFQFRFGKILINNIELKVSTTYLPFVKNRLFMESKSQESIVSSQNYSVSSQTINPA